MIKVSLLTLAFLAAGQGALAQPTGMNAGGQIQQIPPAPEQPRSLPDIRIERGHAAPPPAPAGIRIVVRALHFTVQTRFTETELVAAAGFRPGAEMDLADLRAMVARVSDFYSRHGYFVAQAYLPAQDVESGAVTIAVIEGHYGKIGLDNRAHISDGLAHSIMAGLEPGQIVAAPPLERRLLLLQDLPGVNVRAILSPGETVGASDLLVDLTPGRRVTGDLEADNAGSRYTGEWRGGGTINFNEPTGHGDVASLRYLTSGSGMNYVRGDYQFQVQDLTLGVAYAYLNYQLGHEFAPLHARGTADIASLYASYPLIRSRDTNLRVLADFDYRTFRDEVRVTSSVSDRAAEVGAISLIGGHHDHLLGGGWTNFSITATAGNLDIKTPLARAIDRVSARSDGGYGKLSFDVSRLQTLYGPLSLYGEARGQIASKNLDTSEKMELGGAYGVRAYPEGEAYGDEGYILTAEARLTLATLPEPLGGRVQAVGFGDHGSVTLDKSPWFHGFNTRTLSAAGVGLDWSGGHGVMVRVSYAFRLGDERAISAPDRSGRLWVQVYKFF